MSAWEYADPITEEGLVRSSLGQVLCAFCKSELKRIDEDLSENILLGKIGSCWDAYSYRVLDCPGCGWWWADIEVSAERSYGGKGFCYSSARLGATARLRNLDLYDVTIPLNEVRSYLTARYDSRFTVHPRRFEEVVGSVFRDLGYRVRVTAFGGDGGIDVVLDGDDDATIGVQVKRYKGRIEAEAIRALTGALVLNGCTEGIFVTTSAFQPGCEKTAALASLRGYPVQLIDADRFYDALKLSQRTGLGEGSFDRSLFEKAEFIEVESDEIPCFP